MIFMKNAAGVSIVGLAAALAFAPTAAIAQPTANSETARLDDPQEAAEAEAVIVVSGSKLNRPVDVSPVPVTRIDEEAIILSGATNLGDVINELPSLGLGASRTTNIGTGAPATIGATLLNLRSLGSARTLVVVDGKRHIGSIAGSTSVDIGSIPTALVEAIDVTTGGASVSYGADAVSGVVNIITRDDFEGMDLEYRAGLSGEGDAEDHFISATIGGNFADDRGNAVMNVTYNTSGSVDGSARDWLARQTVFVPDASNPGGPQVLADNGRIASTNYNGILLGALTGQRLQFTPDGGVSVFDPGVAPGGTFNIGGDGLNLNTLQRIANPQERILINAKAHYDITENVRFNLDGKYYGVEASFRGQPTGDFFTHFEDGDFFTLAPDNPFLPFGDPLFDTFFAANPGALAIPGVGTIEILPGASAGRSSVLLSRVHQDIGVRSTEIKRDTYRIMAGIEGSVPSLDLTYDLYYQYGETDSTRRDLGTRDSRRFRLATDVTSDAAGILGAAGAPVCRATLQAAQGGGAGLDTDVRDCVPLNIFGVGLASQEAIDYVNVDLLSISKVAQDVAGAQINGSLFELPAGAIGFVVGAEYRKESSRFTPDSRLLAGDTFDGASLAVAGSYDVTEAFAEIYIPLLADQPFFDTLSIEGGARISNYSTVGTTVAYRAGINWAPVPDFRLRGGYSKAVRAPNINELFSPRQEGAQRLTDPCDSAQVNLGPNPARRLANCTAQLAPLGLDPLTFDDPLDGITKTIVVGGNPDLLEETSKSWTAGIVLKPRMLPGFSATADFFDVKISKAISTPSVDQIVSDCVDRFETIDNEFCGLFNRVSTGGQIGLIENVISTTINIDALEVRGVDFSARYSFELGADSRVALTIGGTYLARLNVLPASDAAEVNRDAGELGSPRWRFNTQAIYNGGPVTLSWLMRYIGGGVLDIQAQEPFSDPFGVDAATIHDAQARFEVQNAGFADTMEFYVGVNNVFNFEPAPFSRAGTSTGNSGLYDPIGRFFYAGALVKF